MRPKLRFLLAKDLAEVALATIETGGLSGAGALPVNDIQPSLRVYADQELLLDALTALSAWVSAHADGPGPVRISGPEPDGATIAIEYPGQEVDAEILRSTLAPESLVDTPPPGSDDPALNDLFRALRIIQAHEGHLTAKSAGAQIRLAITLPEVKPRILLVEDDPDYVDLISEYLKPVDGSVVRASDGISALKLIAEGAPHAVILDLAMPMMDGMSLLTAMRQSGRGSDTPVIVFSSFDSVAARKKAFGLGANAFLVKPAGLRQVAECVNRILHKRGFQNEPAEPPNGGN